MTEETREWDECPSCLKQLDWQLRRWNCIGICPCGQHLEIDFDDIGPDENGQMDEFWQLKPITKEQFDQRRVTYGDEVLELSANL